MSETVEGKLRGGVVYRTKRWSGDTFGDVPDGEVNAAATEQIMEQGAERLAQIERQVRKLADGCNKQAESMRQSALNDSERAWADDLDDTAIQLRALLNGEE